ncbi:3-hydroxyacyl-CoA dehydrogenase family protein [Patulibacter minatonensis]|uniref:3-hydroxyacyl-CoA dehydrogenase family protein n=1 Tax=Patulibacter minatonensis TaxID=298163 RepID=UPI00047C8893|nr:3-hydroxyacyl-CoA dehydrogenase family protein [Patulibacter minatonensis]
MGQRTRPGAVAVVGAGTMGVGIAYVFAAAGHETLVVEPDAARRDAAVRVVAEQAAAGVRRGKLDDAAARDLGARVRCVEAIDALPVDLELLVESVPERLALKQDVLRAAEARGPALLASNTSSLSIDALADRLERPEAFCGMHFFNPVWSLKLVEVVRGTATSDAAVEHARALTAGIGKQAIVARDVAGFATSRLDVVAALEAIRMLEDGVASAEDIDRAATLAYRHPVGPLRLSDIVGLDVRLDIAEHLSGVYGARFAVPGLLRRKVAAGELGQKSGRGFFAW